MSLIISARILFVFLKKLKKLSMCTLWRPSPTYQVITYMFIYGILIIPKFTSLYTLCRSAIELKDLCF